MMMIAQGEMFEVSRLLRCSVLALIDTGPW